MTSYDGEAQDPSHCKSWRDSSPNNQDGKVCPACCGPNGCISITHYSQGGRLLGIRTISIYTEPDSASQHVAHADQSFLLTGDATKAYLDGEQIINIARSAGAQAIIPGYGFLSENATFARSVAEAGLVFVGPSSESIEQFGLKHTVITPSLPRCPDLKQETSASISTTRNHLHGCFGSPLTSKPAGP